MRITKRFALFIFILLINSFCFAAESKELNFATEATYPPFEYIDESGQIKGFDIDIINALCAQMKRNCHISHQAFNSLIPSVKLGKFDGIIAALGVTPERQQQVNFTNAYYEPSASFVAPLDKQYTLTSLLGKKIGVQEGSTFEKYLNEKYSNKMTLNTYASIQEAFLDLAAGRVDAVLADTPIATAWLNQNENKKQFGIVGAPIIDHPYFGAGYAIAVNKSNDALVTALNQALATIKANGTYDKITQKYFSR